MPERNDPCWCGSGKKWKKCHAPDTGPKELIIKEKYKKSFGILIKTKDEIEGITRACQVAKEILQKVAKRALAGVTTNELDAYARELHEQYGAIAAPLNYGHPPFPKSICTSKNEVICHGIPDDEPLKEGDILNIDVTSIVDGYYGDCSVMVCVGVVSEEKQRVVGVSFECLEKAIAILKPGLLVSEIGKVISDHAEKRGCSVVHQFIGHGTGVLFHEPPNIPHHRNNLAIPLAAGMTFTIEPMINAGVADAVVDANDHWTARTADGKASAQWEHTVLITDQGCKVLTEL